MILSVSRRTDIPAFYSDWFYNRIKEGYVCVRNPMNKNQVSKINISKEFVDCIVFWTKNPEKMINRLAELDGYNYYFQFSINPYNQDIESSVPRKKRIFDTFKKLSDKICPKRVIWRYDPILITKNIDINYHLKYFEIMAKELSGYSNICVISFIDNYKKTERNIKTIEARELIDYEVNELSQYFAEISSNYGFVIQTCAEKYDLEKFGIKHGRCIDNELIESIINARLNTSKDTNQREECGCIQSIDIGEYNTCNHNCIYCYANFNRKMVQDKVCQHNPDSPLLIGNIKDTDIIKDRKVVSLIEKNGLFK